MSERVRRLAAGLFVAALLLLAPLGAAAVAAGTGGSSLGALVLPAVGPGYAVLSQGPIDPATFASSAPDSSAVSSALSTLRGTVSSYQRTWTDTARLNAVQDMLFRFSSVRAAQIFLQSARTSLRSGKIVSSGPLPGVPGADRVTYFGATDESGVGQAVTLRVNGDVALLSFFSASAGNAEPITQADASEVAAAQAKALRTAPASKRFEAKAAPGTAGVSAFVPLAVLVLGLLVVALVVVRRRRSRSDLPHASTS